ncbi:MAG TPA: hypothetical protein ENN73_04240 [Firmicutes bacterium]|nr:hypothetical protein [Bacillota bacterium]
MNGLFSLFKRRYPLNKSLRVLLLGIDGASWNILDPIMEEGMMPVLKSLMEKSSAGLLKSNQPYISPSVWTTIMTGKSREKHGILGFYNSKSDLKARRVWEILNYNSIPVGTLGVFLTSPPEKKYLFQIPAWIKVDNTTYPEKYSPALNWDINDDLILSDNCGITEKTKKYIRDCKKDPERFRYRYHFAQMYIQTDIFLNMLRESEPGFSAMVYYGSDALLHWYMHHYNPDWFPGLEIENDPELARIIPDYFKELDSELGRILNSIPKDCSVLIVSDHGQIPSPKELYLGYRLAETEILKLLGIWDIAKPSFTNNIIRIEIPESKIERIYRILFESRIVEPDLPLLNGIKMQKNHLELEFNIILNKDPKLNTYSFTLNGETYPLSRVLIPFRRFGIHGEDGLYIFSGKKFKTGIRGPAMNIKDILPHILTDLDLPSAKDLDGKIYPEIFKEGTAFTDKMVESYDDLIPPESNSGVSDNEKVKKQLKSLGYIE